MAADLSGVGLASPTLRGGTYGGVTVVRGRWRGPADTPGLLAVATAGRPRSVDRPLRAHVARCRRNGGATQRSGWCAERGGGRRRPALSGPGPGNLAPVRSYGYLNIPASGALLPRGVITSGSRERDEPRRRSASRGQLGPPSRGPRGAPAACYARSLSPAYHSLSPPYLGGHGAL